jgi:hypothetical protein
MTQQTTTDTSCTCAATHLLVSGPPLLRFICHCTICQRFNRAPEADMVVFRGGHARLADVSTVEFKRFKRLLAVDRGACRQCGDPVIETLTLPLFPALAFVPASRVAAKIDLPLPSMRVFYDSRVSDAGDDLPRHEGFIASQTAFLRLLLRALRTGP